MGGSIRINFIEIGLEYRTVYETGSGSCPVTGFYINRVEPSCRISKECVSLVIIFPTLVQIGSLCQFLYTCNSAIINP